MKKTDELNFMMENGALVIQAHPYREDYYIDHIRLFPRHVHGVEVINASRSDEENSRAEYYCESYGLIGFAGSDNHFGARCKKLAGISSPEPICGVDDFVEKVKKRKIEIFTLVNI